jgi:hypothetical protein
MSKPHSIGLVKLIFGLNFDFTNSTYVNTGVTPREVDALVKIQ